MISQRLADFDDEFKSLPDALTSATIEMYEAIIQKFLPTPTKIYYLFNLRDISKIFQGLLRADRKLITTKQTMIRLWIHECFRYGFSININLHFANFSEFSVID
jgi:dynein heavy chain